MNADEYIRHQLLIVKFRAHKIYYVTYASLKETTMDKAYIAIAKFFGVEFFVGAYSMRRGRRNVEEKVMEFARDQIRYLFVEEWRLTLPIYELRVMPQEELGEMPPLLVQAESIFKSIGDGDDNPTH